MMCVIDFGWVEELIEWLQGAVDAVVGWLGAAWAVVWEAALGWSELVFDTAVAVSWWLVRAMVVLWLDFGVWAVEQVPDVVPGCDTAAVQWVVTIVMVWDVVFPLSEMFQIMGLWVAFVAAFVGVKLTVKMIPTVG